MGYIVKKEDGSEKINYDNDYFPSYIFDGWILPGVSWANIAHFHDDIEFITVKSGKMGYNINGKNVYLEQGDTIFVNSGQIHYSFSVQKERCFYYIYILHPSILASSFVIENDYINPIIKNSNVDYIIFRKNDTYGKIMKRLAKKMYETLGNELNTASVFFEIWSLIYDYFNENNLLNDNDSKNMLLDSFKNMLAFIHNNYKEHITLDDIAASVNVSRTYCNKLFNKFSGQTPMENLLRFRLEKVADYLMTSDMSMSDIAYETGFSGASYMAENFKKIYGMSPREYKKHRD